MATTKDGRASTQALLIIICVAWKTADFEIENRQFGEQDGGEWDITYAFPFHLVQKGSPKQGHIRQRRDHLVDRMPCLLFPLMASAPMPRREKEQGWT